MTITQDMIAPSWCSGDYYCTAPGQSGNHYTGVVAGATIAIDIRDLPAMTQNGFVTTGSPSQS